MLKPIGCEAATCFPARDTRKITVAAPVPRVPPLRINAVTAICPVFVGVIRISAADTLRSRRPLAGEGAPFSAADARAGEAPLAWPAGALADLGPGRTSCVVAVGAAEGPGLAAWADGERAGAGPGRTG